MSGQGLVLASVGGSKSDGRCVRGGVEEATVSEANDAVKKTADLAGEDLSKLSHCCDTWWSSAGEGVGELRVSRNGVRLDFVDVVPQIRELFKQ